MTDPLAARVQALIAQWRRQCASVWELNPGSVIAGTYAVCAAALEAALAAAQLPPSHSEGPDYLRCDRQFTEMCRLPNGHDGPHISTDALRHIESLRATVDLLRKKP